MKTNNKSIINTFYGVLFVGIFALIATIIAEAEFFKKLGISPLIIGIILGIFYANTLKHKLPNPWQSGIIFSTKYILRFGIILYGFRLTFQNLQEVGINGILIAFCVVFFTFIFGYFIGTKVLKMDKELTILCSAGSSICGAAAVMATQSVLKNEAYKSAVAVSFVVIFGTIGMFLYPFLDKLGVFLFTSSQMGVYIGATLHEVAHVVAAGNALGEVVSTNAIIEKMIRVIFLVPFLILLSFWLIKTNFHTKKEKSRIVIPWFAIFFIVVVGFNSLELLEENIIKSINYFDTFALTMAMTALGMETSYDKFKNTGIKPLYLSLILFIWLMVGGYFLVKFFF
ncbi:YeiH family protein [Arcobacter sp. L]|uniref:YeiH family protein n=1 Tax=Arcobacter sp. L TaxID=944547 RepID=UPI0002296145|nr:YeiH family protein [Arcobacter sp. L]BAK73536.1 putative integral membrane protein [Arcobacter sp. L]